MPTKPRRHEVPVLRPIDRGLAMHHRNSIERRYLQELERARLFDEFRKVKADLKPLLKRKHLPHDAFARRNSLQRRKSAIERQLGVPEAMLKKMIGGKKLRAEVLLDEKKKELEAIISASSAARRAAGETMATVKTWREFVKSELDLYVHTLIELKKAGYSA